jgi:hypothetical protein
MNSNKHNSNNFLLGVSSNKNNSLEKVNNNKVSNNYSNTMVNNKSNAYSPLETKKIVFGIIDKLESDIVELNNKINYLNKEKSNLKNISNKEIEELKQVIKKLYMVLSSLYKSSNLSKNDRIELLNKLKTTIEENESFLQITNKIIRNDRSFNNKLNKTFNNTALVVESLNNNNNVSLSNIIASKNSESKEEIENNSRMTDNTFLKREGIANNSSNSGFVNNMSIKLPNNETRSMNNMTERVSNNGVEVVNNMSVKLPNNGSQSMNNMSERVSNNGVEVVNNMSVKLPNNGSQSMNNMSSENVKEISNNKNIYKSENKELTQSKKIPLITKIEEHKINQEKANRNFNEYKKFL